jgi:hypothetical protein
MGKWWESIPRGLQDEALEMTAVILNSFKISNTSFSGTIRTGCNTTGSSRSGASRGTRNRKRAYYWLLSNLPVTQLPLSHSCVPDAIVTFSGRWLRVGYILFLCQTDHSGTPSILTLLEIVTAGLKVMGTIDILDMPYSIWPTSIK